jgi:hypothetical protein
MAQRIEVMDFMFVPFLPSVVRTGESCLLVQMPTDHQSDSTWMPRGTFGANYSSLPPFDNNELEAPFSGLPGKTSPFQGLCPP